MEALIAFLAALVALRLAGGLARRYRTKRSPALAAWSASLLAYAVASGALAWGAAAGWDGRSFRAYYLFGGLLTASLLGVGSLLLAGRRWAAPLGLLYAGLAVGIAVAVPLTEPVSGSSIPEAQDHLAFVPARLVAVLGNTLGTAAVVVVALLTIRRRPLPNALILAGVAVAAAGSALAGLGEAETAVFIAVAALLLYAGFVTASGERLSLPQMKRFRARYAPPAPDPGTLASWTRRSAAAPQGSQPAENAPPPAALHAGRGRPSRPLAARQPLPQTLVDDLRVRLPAGRLHHLPDEEAEQALLAAAVCGHLARIRAENLLDQRVERR